MQVIIPMSGSGQRFNDAGFTTIKPLIEVHGKTFVEYVISLFSPNDQFIFICDEKHLAETALRTVLLNLVPTATIVAIAAHKKGPVYAVQQAFDFIDDNAPCIVNYCDFFMNWNYTQFTNAVLESNCDGAIPCYTGFHPHLLHTHNVYAGCKIDENKKLISIKEKFSFEIDKTKGHHSVGTYYFKSGKLLKYYVDDLIKKEYNLNGEYYASMLYEQMLEDGLFINVYDGITHFCQWGTPQDFTEYKMWTDIFIKNKNYGVLQHQCHLPNTTMLMPMAGNGKRFLDEGYLLQKPLIAVDGLPMYKRALQDLPQCDKHIFIIKNDINLTELPSNSTIIAIEATTQGQATTCLLAKDQINNTQSLFITPCDNGLIYDITAFKKLQQQADVIIFSFRNNTAVVNNPNQYGWVQVENNVSLSISCKKAISETPMQDHAITGAFWFKQGNYFVTAAENMITQQRKINNEYYVDECINDCIKMGLKVFVFEIAHYICWGTPNDLRTYLYWQNYFNQLGNAV
jgi:NDP-sugar pyrophosphorylase family protein